MAKGGGVMAVLDLTKPKGDDMSEGDGKDSAEDEALADFFSLGKSGNIAGAKSALKDFLGICYPSLGGDYSEEGDASEEA